MTDAPSPTGLSAEMTPVAVTPVTALSQAWRDALGFAKKRPAAQAARSTAHVAGPASAAPAAGSAAGRAVASPLPERAHVRVGDARLGRAEAPAGRERIDDARARRIRDLAEHVVHAAGTAAHVDLETEHGAIRLLVQQRGLTTRIVAVCPPETRGEVAEALERVRLALEKRGITVDVQATNTQGAA